MVDYEDIREARIAEAVQSFPKTDAPLARFTRDLFDHGLSEDIARYSAKDLSTLAKATFKTLQKRASGKPLIQFGKHVVRARGPDDVDQTVTTIDIVNDNMPFLIDSIVPEIRDAGHEMLLIVHPIFAIERDKAGVLQGTPKLFKADGTSVMLRESVMHIHVPELTAAEAKALKTSLAQLLKNVRGVVQDWRQMVDKLESTIRHYKTNPPPLEVQELAEAVQFLEWLMDNNYTFLGLREYRFDENADRFIQPVKGSGLGILRDPTVHILRRGNELVEITPEVREFMLSPEPLIISKANVRSQIHRRTYMDYIGVKLYDAMGNHTGELRLVGLFTSTVYARSIRAIPYLRHKANRVMENAGFDANSHAGKALWNVLESYPRDELFQIGVELLEEFSLSVLALDGRAKVRILPRWDKFDRYVSVLVFVPRDRYNTSARERIGKYLAGVYDGRVSAYYPGFPEGLLARVHFIIGRNLTPAPTVTRAELEESIERIIETWEDGLEQVLARVRADKSARAYINAFSAAYREAYEPEEAVTDIASCQCLTTPELIGVDLYVQEGTAPSRVGLKLFHVDTPIELSQRVPLLENLGFRVINERTYKISPDGDTPRYLHDMTLETASGASFDLNDSKARLESAIFAIWRDRTGNDGYNALAVTAGLEWRNIAMLRTVSRYLQQVGVTYSQDYMWQALNSNPAIAADLVKLFHARFDPKVKARDKAMKASFGAIERALEAVTSLDEDQIIRRFRSVIMGTLRTNFFKPGRDGQPISEISFKLAPRDIEDMPEPRPYREIFMTSPRVEGLHLRFGKIARGGLRWSDRPEDFRTEVLGLVKAQQVKNAVIVPVGSKGGFVPKKLHSGMTREAFIDEGTEAYRTFISNLLEITDNLDGDNVVPPEKVVRHDGDDPYLVVAADKGTATFSDTANGISQDYNFWLDDAFASGGSAGYDHKKMGITARGAWEAVKRHFREMDKDIQTEPFTAAGVGDMSGDVFGNGMLLSKATKLVAAFDHRDIFLDPDPDPAKSWVERKRIFDLGRSSWQDYDTSLISKGGGVFSRSTKSIKLSPEIQSLLGVKKATMSPFELMQAILKMNVELFWFGGIGTYVRGPLESDADVGDRANDVIRIEAADFGAKVVGEGANLGMTQRARIAYQKLGGRCNSDAIDNSAGVNSSDVEVNIKIALGAAVRGKKLTLSKRNTLLEAMTDEVADLVLRNNYQQTLSISLSERRGMEDFGHQSRYMQDLEERGLLNREVEDLPNDVALEERSQAGEPLTRAEIGVILAYAKITLFDDLIESTLPDDPYLERELFLYFPSAMQKKYAAEISSHKLRREIIATQVCNAMINRGGATYLARVGDQTGRNTVEIGQAYIVVRDAFSLRALNQSIDALDTKVPGDIQLALYGAIQDLLLSQTVWVLRHVDFSKPLEETIAPFQAGVNELKKSMKATLPKYLQTAFEKRRKAYEKEGVPTDIAEEVAFLPVLSLAPEIIDIAAGTKSNLADCAAVYFDIAGRFLVGKLDDMARSADSTDYYDGLALQRARQQLWRAHRAIVWQVLGDLTCGGKTDKWYKANEARASQARQAIEDILASEPMTVSKVAVAASIIGDLVVHG